MSLDSFAHLYEEATIDIVRHMTQRTLDGHFPPLRSDMTILDLACGSGAVTRAIYERCEAQGLKPPKIFGLDIGPNFIDTFNENKAVRHWDTAEGIACDAPNMEMFSDSTFDIVIMSFGLFAVKDADANKAAAEIHRVLKPGGQAAFTTWRETWVERMFTGANAAVGRPREEIERFTVGKWLKMKVARDVLLAGGFEPRKLQHSTLDDQFSFSNTVEILNRFDTPFWRGVGTDTWTDDQKTRWRSEVEKLITDNEKAKGALPVNAWLFVAEKYK
ncbi:S-adenosyl-L-methionine-dependent methyltransferase [Ilyonectria sp. MPI-CAGE-AT-0026]|nr:S-adenosyl-L-methionine-dependent methyltransferase [Ilyonectria sp. MPI-CAGE-AT-0026]